MSTNIVTFPFKRTNIFQLRIGDDIEFYARRPLTATTKSLLFIKSNRSYPISARSAENDNFSWDTFFFFLITSRYLYANLCLFVLIRILWHAFSRYTLLLFIRWSFEHFIFVSCKRPHSRNTHSRSKWYMLMREPSPRLSGLPCFLVLASHSVR